MGHASALNTFLRVTSETRECLSLEFDDMCSAVRAPFNTYSNIALSSKVANDKQSDLPRRACESDGNGRGVAKGSLSGP